ncbi:UDP-N-acetylglucosamine transferase subunit ALG13 homolog [Uloborus diversus]|uniref:UDP-N-acetylglucosamine transferase subunit ALG13 homolog n=1 Tax=Uloborus diversus TaxID=327109 RepID=UPI00240A42BC|nr:UDP-N-acetylglucosamine transferase subunit ALG13 homolog [Uloborus diversus]
MSVFVTVGSTSFDDLIRTMTSDKVLRLLGSKGILKVTLQVGRGEYVPENTYGDGKITLDWFRFKDDITKDIQDATLVVGHGGAGTILECLGQRRPILVVLNEKLMENHQGELAERLEEEGMLISTTCSGLLVALEKFFSNPPKMESYASEPYMFRGFLEGVMGFR